MLERNKSEHFMNDKHEQNKWLWNLPCLRDTFEDETTAVLFHDPNLNKTS